MNDAVRRALLIACAIVLAGCTASVEGSTAESAAPSEPASTLTSVPPNSTAAPPPRFAPAVEQPKDARGISPCDLLTSAQLVELGLRPESAEAGGSTTAATCGWRSSDPGNPAGVQLNTELAIPVLDGLYLLRDVFAVFEPIEVAGHPGFHADRNAGPVCTIYTAISDYQGIATDGNLGGRPLPDPCAPSRRMAELILSNLPPLR